MADGNWLSPRQVNALGHDEQQQYIRQRLNDIREETSDSEDDEECDLPSEAGQLYTGRDGTMWSTRPPNTGRFRTHNILRCARHGPVQRTNCLSILETFKLIMSEEIFDIIIRENKQEG